MPKEVRIIFPFPMTYNLYDVSHDTLLVDCQKLEIATLREREIPEKFLSIITSPTIITTI